MVCFQFGECCFEANKTMNGEVELNYPKENIYFNE